jgi:hypothetical protein
LAGSKARTAAHTPNTVDHTFYSTFHCSIVTLVLSMLLGLSELDDMPESEQSESEAEPLLDRKERRALALMRPISVCASDSGCSWISFCMKWS